MCKNKYLLRIQQEGNLDWVNNEWRGAGALLNKAIYRGRLYKNTQGQTNISIARIFNKPNNLDNVLFLIFLCYKKVKAIPANVASKPASSHLEQSWGRVLLGEVSGVTTSIQVNLSVPENIPSHFTFQIVIVSILFILSNSICTQEWKITAVQESSTRHASSTWTPFWGFKWCTGLLLGFYTRVLSGLGKLIFSIWMCAYYFILFTFLGASN